MHCRRKVSLASVLVFAALADWACVVASPLFGPVFVYQRPIDAMVDITNDLGVAVLQDHVGTRSNFAFSPYGVASVLVLLYEGARGESARQIHDTLHFPWERDVTRIGFRDIHRHLRTYFSHEGYLSGITLSKNHTSLLPEYQRVLRFYGYDVSRPQGSTTRRPEDKTSGPLVTTPDGLLLVITNETSSSAEQEATTIVTTVEEVEIMSTSVDVGMKTTTNGDLLTTTEVNEGTATEKETTTALPVDTEGTTEGGQEATTNVEATENPEVKVTDSTIVTSEGDGDESTSTETAEGIKETVMAATETVQEIKDTTQTVDETTTKFETTTQDLKETVAKETEETNETTQDIKDVTEEVMETTNRPIEPSTLTDPVTTEMPTDEIEIIPDVEMPVDSMSENQVSTVTEEQTTTNPAAETTTDSPSQEPSESPSPSSSLLPSPSPEETEDSTEEFVDANVLPEKVTETTEETDKETTATEPEDQTSTLEETSTSTDETTVYTTEEVESTTTDYTTVVDEEGLTTTEGKTTTEKDVTKEKIPILSMKTEATTNKDGSGSRGPRTRRRRRRALRDDSGLEYPDMSLQLQNGMYGSSVARNVDVLNLRAPRAPFLIDGVLEESVPVMKYTAVFPYAFVPRLHAHALEFPLDDERYKLLLILPVERRGLRQLIHDLGSCPLREVFRALTPTRVHAVIPSFMVEGFVILTSTLQQMGIWDVFDPRRSNLSGMSGDPELFVRNIEQSITVVIRNYVEIVDIQTRTMAARSSPEVFLATHPFLYFVVDTETRVSLMAGKIVDPLNSRIY